jgi:hypothetical protein
LLRPIHPLPRRNHVQLACRLAPVSVIVPGRVGGSRRYVTATAAHIPLPCIAIGSLNKCSHLHAGFLRTSAEDLYLFREKHSDLICSSFSPLPSC